MSNQQLSHNQSAIGLKGLQTKKLQPLQFANKSQIQEASSPTKLNNGDSPSKMTLNTQPFSPNKTMRHKKINVDPAYQIAQYYKSFQYFNKQSYAKKIIRADGGQQYEHFSVCGDNNDVIKQYGLGMYLYLQLIKRLFVTFLVMSAFMALPCAIYHNGSGLSSYVDSFTISLARFSMGNLNNSSNYEYTVVTICQILSGLTFLIFIFHWKAFISSTVQQNQKDSQMINPSLYVTSVVGFDPDTPDLQHKLIDYFNQVFQGCYQVQIVYDYEGSFNKFVHYNDSIEKLQKQKQILKQIKKGTEDLEQYQAQLQKQQQQLIHLNYKARPMYAIIHFSTLKNKFKFINFCRRWGFISSIFCDINCCRDIPPPKDLFLRRYPLYIENNAMSKPQQINWPALDQGKCSSFLRWILATLFMIIIIIITSSMIALCTLYVSSTSSCQSFNPLTTLVQATAAGGQTLYCYCSANIASIYTNTAVETACSTLTNSIIVTNVMQIAASVVSSISNIILMLFVQLLANRLLKPSTKTGQYSFTFAAVLISNYINSTLLPLIMNGNIFSFQSISYLSFINFINFANVSIFSDFTKDWYALISPYYLNFIIIASIMPFVDLLISSLTFCLRNRKVSNACQQNLKPNNQDPMIQSQANKIITSFAFDLPVQQAMIVLHTFIVLMYYTLIPLLLPVYTIGLGITAICKKTIIYKYSVRVPQNQNLSLKTASIMPFIFLFHCLMGLWARTAPGIFNSYPYYLSLTAFNNTVDRIFNDMPYLALTALAAVWLILDLTLVSLITCLKNTCTKDQLQIPVQYAQIQKMPYATRVAKSNILSSYKLVNHPVYGHAIKAYKQLIKNHHSQINLNNINQPVQ